MKRRHLIGAITAAATGAGIAGLLGKDHKPAQTSAAQTLGAQTLGAPALSKNRRQLRLATSWPKDFPGLGNMPNRFSQALYAMSDGVLDVKVYAAGELVGALECFDATSTGAADMYHAAEYYWTGKAKAFSFFTAVPMGMTPAEMTGWVDFGGGQELWHTLSAKFNIKAFHCGNTGHQTGGWFKKEINSLEDFKGLRIRMPGLAGEIIRRLGGASVRLSGGEIYQALQSGSIDATEWVGPWNDLAFGFYREAPHYYTPGFHEPGAALSIGINLDVWNSLTPSLQAMIKHAAKATNDISIGEYTHQNGIALETLKRDHNIYPKVFSDEILTKIGELSEQVIAELSTSDALTKQIYESYFTARASSRRWTEISDGLYIPARQKALDISDRAHISRPNIKGQ